MSQEERAGYQRDVKDARQQIEQVSGLDFELPNRFQIQNRHHWISINIQSFERIMAPLSDQEISRFIRPVQTVNSGTMAVLLTLLGKNVLGQYDPLLLTDETDHGLYFVHPNIQHVGHELNVDMERFRRWIVFHEVTHAAEFGAAPWLSPYLEKRVHDGITSVAAGKFESTTFRELDATMTAVEGYAELLMDVAFDQEYHDLREKLDNRRRQAGPLSGLLRRLFGLDMKRRQYERGKVFFESIVTEYDLDTASTVWTTPENLPTWEEFDDPAKWIDRMDHT